MITKSKHTVEFHMINIRMSKKTSTITTKPFIPFLCFICDIIHGLKNTMFLFSILIPFVLVSCYVHNMNSVTTWRRRCSPHDDHLSNLPSRQWNDTLAIERREEENLCFCSVATYSLSFANHIIMYSYVQIQKTWRRRMSGRWIESHRKPWITHSVRYI